MDEKLHVDPVLGEVLLRKSWRARGISLRVHPVKGVIVTVPRWAPWRTALLFLAARRDWVLEARRRQQERLSAMDASLPEGESVDTLRRRAKKELPPRLRELADRYGFTPGRITIKHNLSNWGSCSRKGNINLNLNLLRLSAPLRDYVLLHELCHLTEPNHGPGFHRLLEDLLLSLFSAETSDPAYAAFLQAAEKSRARFPLTFVLEKAIKQYRLV